MTEAHNKARKRHSVVLDMIDSQVIHHHPARPSTQVNSKAMVLVWIYLRVRVRFVEPPGKAAHVELQMKDGEHPVSLSLKGERHAHLIKLSIKQERLLDAAGMTMTSRKIAERLEMWEIFGETWIPALPQQHPLTLHEGQGLIFRKTGVRSVTSLEYYIQLTLPAWATANREKVPSFVIYAASRGWGSEQPARHWDGGAGLRKPGRRVEDDTKATKRYRWSALDGEDDEDNMRLGQRRRLDGYLLAKQGEDHSTRAASTSSRAASTSSRASSTWSSRDIGSPIEITDDEDEAVAGMSHSCRGRSWSSSVYGSPVGTYGLPVEGTTPPSSPWVGSSPAHEENERWDKGKGKARASSWEEQLVLDVE